MESEWRTPTDTAPALSEVHKRADAKAGLAEGGAAHEIRHVGVPVGDEVGVRIGTSHPLPRLNGSVNAVRCRVAKSMARELANNTVAKLRAHQPLHPAPCSKK